MSTEISEPATPESQAGWLTIDEAAARLGVSRARVRRLLEDRQLGAKAIDGRPHIPEAFFDGDEPVRHLRGTLILLHDAGFDDDEACSWMLTENDLIGDIPIRALRAGRKTIVRQTIASLAF